MPYLTYDKYIEFGFDEIEETEFKKLLPKASDVIDGITRHFYQFNDLETDHEFRKKQFKKAIAAQVEHFHELGGTSSSTINSPLNFQAGRTQVSMGANNQREANKLISKDVYMYLNGTGLLYRGVATRW